MATEHADELRALNDEIRAVVGRLDTGGPVDQFQGSVGDMRRRPPNQDLVNVMRALLAAVVAIDGYLHSGS